MKPYARGPIYDVYINILVCVSIVSLIITHTQQQSSQSPKGSPKLRRSICQSPPSFHPYSNIIRPFWPPKSQYIFIDYIWSSTASPSRTIKTSFGWQFNVLPQWGMVSGSLKNNNKWLDELILSTSAFQRIASVPARRGTAPTSRI